MISNKNTIKTALRGLRTNKSRSALTILGIVIGITSIILVMSIGQGANELVLNEIQALGSTTLVVVPGKEPKGPSDIASFFLDSIKQRELDAITNKANVRGVLDVTPEVLVPGTVSYQGDTYSATIVGTSELFTDLIDIYPSDGVFFSNEDVRQKENVAVIGAKVKEELFGLSDAIGERIKIKDRSFRVVGVFPDRGQVIFFNVDHLVLIPYSTAQTYLLGTNFFNELIVRTESEELVDTTVSDIQATLRELHNITNSDDDDFHIHTQKDLVERVNIITSILTTVLATVAAISLLVGGIGIMNIMLVSVTERTREIGLRKSIGATKNDIVRQFLFEAVILTTVGGMVGIFLGSTFSFLTAIILSKFVGLNWHFTFPFSAAILGIAVSGIVGLIFGIYPARQAANKEPIEALRYE